MLAGCGIGVLASALGGAPVALARRGSPGARMPAALASMALRSPGGPALSGLAVALSGWFERGPLLIWMAIRYVAQLVVDTRYALRGLIKR